MAHKGLWLVMLLSVGGACGDDAGGTLADAALGDAASLESDASTEESPCVAIPGKSACDDFERAQLGANWATRYDPDSQVAILDSSDLGMEAGGFGFFLINWTADDFGPDQYCEATIPLDATPGWVYMVYVRWRASDAARYGFAYNGDMGQASYDNWIFKYDGVPSNETRVFAQAPAAAPVQPGDTIRVEVEGYTLRGYHNGNLVLMATDTDSTKIADGETGLAARWATGNQGTLMPAKVWESWAGGEL